MCISVKGYGIRIFDSTGTKSLCNWTVSTGLNEILLTNKFDLYAADFLNNRVLSYQPWNRTMYIINLFIFLKKECYNYSISYSPKF
jgi:hypothetical protein